MCGNTTLLHQGKSTEKILQKYNYWHDQFKNNFLIDPLTTNNASYRDLSTLIVCLFQLALTDKILLNALGSTYIPCYNRDFYNKCLCRALGTPLFTYKKIRLLWYTSDVLLWIFTAWKVPKYRDFSCPYFPAFGLNTENLVRMW